MNRKPTYFLTMVSLVNIKIVVFTLLQLSYVASKVRLEKDLSEEAQFPPIAAISNNPSVPSGHLRPLGYQRRSEGPVTKVDGFPDPLNFFDNYVAAESPVLMSSGFEKTPAMEKWDDAYLKKSFGEETVLVTVKNEQTKTSQDFTPKRFKMKKFLKEYIYEDWYLATPVPQSMLKDLVLPKSLQCGSFRKYLQTTELWLSSGGTSSRLHYHGDHNLHCLLAGRKDFVLINPKYRPDLDMLDSNITATGYSNINPDMINMFSHKAVKDTPWRWATLTPGDCLFVPAGYLHQVRSHGKSLSSTFYWTALPEFEDLDCAEQDLNEKLSLDKVDITWKLVKGRLHLSKTPVDAEEMRKHLMSMIRQEPYLSKDRLEHFISIAADRVLTLDELDRAWKALMIPQNQEGLAYSDIYVMPTALLEDLADIVNTVLGFNHKREEL